MKRMTKEEHKRLREYLKFSRKKIEEHMLKCKEQNREYIDPKKQNFNHSKEWEKIDDTDFNQPIPEGGFKL
jgi:hypothetical protein